MARSIMHCIAQALTILAGFSGLVESADEALWPLQSFKSSSIQTPFMNVTKMGQTEPGYLFFTPHDELRKAGHPVIYSDDGELVWQGKPGNYSALQPQMLNDEPVIAYWSGYSGEGFGFGAITILNSSYDEIHRVTLDCKKEGFVTVFDPLEVDSCIDIHESQLTDNGTILVTAVNVTQADLSAVGGPKNGWVQDALVYEIDLVTNHIVFRWSTHENSDQVAITNTRAPLEGSGGNKSDPYGYPHLNAVYRYGDSYLVSSRYMCSLFFIDSDGLVKWHLHGRTGGDFQLGLGTSFCYQHDTRFVSQSEERVTISLHNNENTEFTGHTSLTTGMVLDVELQGSRQVTLKSRMWDAAEPVFAQSQGSYQSLGNGHSLQNHGATPKIEEYDENGAIVMRARFGYDNSMQTYRTYRYPWVGRPATKPTAVACSDDEEKTVVYVSWNGASDVQAWTVRSGSAVEKTAVRNGFETKIMVEGLDNSDSIVVEAVGGVGDGMASDPVTVGQC
ncbi:unnamed protein product [Penicillium salamii]|nr:unnamed protein product [Penicillium salamii]CAG8363990.1 unnamed protein product [Penicillium salamii]